MRAKILAPLIVGSGLFLLWSARTAGAASCTVPTSPGCETIQAAIDQATDGDTITVREKDAGNNPYFEKLTITSSGISLVAEAGHHPILDGTGVAGDHMILLDGTASSVNDVTVRGFEIRNNLDVSDGSGIRVLGAGDGIHIEDNEIHHITGSDAMGITVYATEATPIRNIVIDGNIIRDCEPARSVEARGGTSATHRDRSTNPLYASRSQG